MREIKPSFRPNGTHYSFRLTNGWETFELLRWAANNTLATTYKWRDNQAAGPKALSPVKTEAARSIIFRILRNSDQLKVVADDLRELEGGQRFIGLPRRDLVYLNEVSKPAPPHDLTQIRNNE